MRTAGVITIGAALLLAAACGGAPSSPGGPSAMASSAPSAAVSAAPAPSVDGVALAEAAVARLQGDPFVAHVEQDAEVTVVEAAAGSLPVGTTMTARMSADLDGDDVGALMTMSVPGADEIRLEFGVMGDDAWARQSGGELVWVSRTDVAPYVDGLFRTIRVTDDPRLLRYVGSETIDGRVVHHLAAAPGTIPYTSGTWDALDLYVLADGTPVRISGTYTGKGDRGETGTGTTTIEFSSFGGPVTIEAPGERPTGAAGSASPEPASATAGSATVDGLPGQPAPWSGAARCEVQAIGPVVWVAVPPEANEHSVGFELFVSTPPNPQAIIGGRPASIVESTGDERAGRMVATVDQLDQCRRTLEGETPEPGAPEGYVCPYRDATATVTVTWDCPNR